MTRPAPCTISLAEDLVSPMLLVHEDLTPDDDPASAVQKAMTAGMRSLEDTARILELPVLEAAVEAICNARHIGIFASGNSIPLAMDLNFRLTKIGLYSRFSLDPTTQEMYASLTTPEDVAIGISHTGSSKDTVYALELAKREEGFTQLLDEHRRIVYRVTFDKRRLRNFWRLWDYVQNWQHTRVYADGEELEKWKVWPYSQHMR